MLLTKAYCETMLEKFDHKFTGNRYYNFFVVFVGLFFAMFILMPDGWRRPAPLMLAVFISAAIAKFSSSKRNQ